jgi:hypothetical protein
VNIEQRLLHALRSTDQVEPSVDLWSRVVHSIEEDREHRRRIRRTVSGVVGVAVILLIVGALNILDSPFGSQVRPGVMEAIEIVALVCLAAILGPGIRRFGRGYAHDLWRTTPELATSLLRLLDVAYVLVFSGYILLTASFEFGPSLIVVGAQVEDLCVRIGGLLLTMGLLHAATIMVLPLIALVSNSTRVGRKLPRWVVALLALMGAAVGLVSVQVLVGGIGAAL